MRETEGGPSLWTYGNLFLAGLPLECGWQAVADHLERVARLGRTVSEHGELVERFGSEVAGDVERSRQEVSDLNDLLKWALEISVEKTLPELLAEYGVVRGSFRSEIEERLDDLMTEISHEFGIPIPLERPWALGELGVFLLERENGMIDAVQSFGDYDRARWGLEDEIPTALKVRLALIDPEDVIFGLQELMKVPWSMYGGMVVARGLTREYLEALLEIDREVLLAWLLCDWQWGASSRTSSMVEAVNVLIPESIPFALDDQLTDLLSHTSRAYLHGEWGMAVILARSVLELVVDRVYSGRRMVRPTTGLAAEIKWLKDTGVLDRIAEQRATEIRHRGNKAVHDDFAGFNRKSVAFDVLRTLSALIVSLRADLESRGRD